MERYGFRIEYAAEKMNKRYGEGSWHFEDEDPSTGIAVTSDGTRVSYGGTPITEPRRPYGVPQNGLTRATVEWDDGLIEQECLSDTLLAASWSYEGLNILKDGDRLTIYHPDDNHEIWSGVIALQQYDLFSEHASGWWIHADQIGIDRDTWAEYFFKVYPAKLTPSKE